MNECYCWHYRIACCLFNSNEISFIQSDIGFYLQNIIEMIEKHNFGIFID